MPGPTGPAPPGSSGVPPMALTAPANFKVTMVSTKVPGARFMTFAPNGDLIVSETVNGQVVVIKPGAPVDAEPTVLASGLERPHGLAFSPTHLFIATSTALRTIPNYPAPTSFPTRHTRP